MGSRQMENNTTKTIVINGHGTKTNQTFKMQGHTLLTPGDLSKPYIFSILPNYSIESDLNKGQLKPVSGSHWNVYTSQSTPNVPDVKISPWTAHEAKNLATQILKNPTLWSNIDNQKGLYLDKDPDAKLIIKKNGDYLALDAEASKTVFEKIANNTYSHFTDGTPVFFYAPKIGKVKILNEISLSNALNQIEKIAGEKLIVLGTCNAQSANDKVISYDTLSSENAIPELGERHTDFTYGPLNKSLYTQEFELVIKTLLNKPNDVSLKFINNDWHFKLHDIDININALLKKVNFSHLELSNQDSIQYFKTQMLAEPFNFHKNLTKAEISAIKDYTGSAYINMNNLLHGKLGPFITGSDLKSILLKTAFLGSGLNKIPTEHSTLHTKTYRGDKPSLDEISDRIDLIKNGEGLSDTPAFFSTSLNLGTAESFAGKALIYFDLPYGKNVSNLSHFPGEKEFILEPCTLQWTHHEVKNGKHIFHAKKVVPLIEGKDTPVEHDIATMSKLYEWANSHNVKTDSITSHLKSKLLENDKQSTHRDDYLEQIRPQSEKHPVNIDLNDCLKMEDNIVGLETNENHTLASSPVTHEAHADSPIFVIHMPLTHELNAASESVIQAGAL